MTNDLYKVLWPKLDVPYAPAWRAADRGCAYLDDEEATCAETCV
jgi:hypothetical protein